MNDNVIKYPNADDWQDLALRAGNNPRKLRAALLYALDEIAQLRRVCIRHGITPEPQRWPTDLTKDWPERRPRVPQRVKFTPPSFGTPSA